MATARVSELAVLCSRYFAEQVLKRGRCVICGGYDHLEAHHLIRKSWIKVNITTEPQVVYDPRIGVPVCGRFSVKGCHELLTTRAILVPQNKVPTAAWEFAAEIGAEHRLAHEITRRA